jgi:hypothetical protein
MLAHSSKIFIDGKEVDYTTGNLIKEGGNTASRLNFVIPGKNTSLRKYWDKEVTFFLDESDASPMFRGFIENLELVEDQAIAVRALDVMGYLTGLDRATVALDNENNLDGSTVGGALKKMIEMANLSKVGTDYIGDVNPTQRITEGIRGDVKILDTITAQMNTQYNQDATDFPRKNLLQVFDDGSKGQLKFEVESDPDTEIHTFTFNYENNMISFTAQNRKIPTIITVAGKDIQATFKHDSAIQAYGEHSMEVNNPLLESRAACLDFAQEIFLANLRAKYEYSLSATEGFYLEENDVVRIIDEQTAVDGKFRIIGKNISFGNGELSLELSINKQPPLLSRFLTT